MEGLRHSLLASAGGTVIILFSTVDALKRMVMTRYAAKDDAGKPLFPVPYAPWKPVSEKYQDKADKVLRAFRMWENIKEWTVVAMPLMWTVALYGGSLPWVTEPMVEVAVLGSSLLFSIGNFIYSKSYIEATEKRIRGFAIRRRVFEFWLFGSIACVACGALTRFGVM